MRSKEKEGLIIVRLFAGEDIIQSLKEICREHNVDTAIVLSAIGQIKKFTMGYSKGKELQLQDYENIHELLSISGTFSWSPEKDDYIYHLYAVVGNKEKQTSGGQLVRGIVQSENEIVLHNTRAKMKLRKSEKAGQVDLSLEEKSGW